MSNVEHLFENALVALENNYYFGEWKRIEKDRHNTDGVSDEVIEVIWELAIYTKYSYEPSIISRNAIPKEWIKDYIEHMTNVFGPMDILTMLRKYDEGFVPSVPRIEHEQD